MRKNIISLQGETAIMAYTTRPSLLKRVCCGEEAAWKDFFVRYAPFIRSIGKNSRVFLTEDETEELLQQTMISLFRNDTVAKYDPARGRFHSYLYSIVERKAVDILRQRKPAESLEKLQQEEAETDRSVLQEVFDAEYRQYIINVLLDDLKGIVSPANFQIFQYSQLQGHSPQETAEVFEIPINRVYTIKKRCIEHLKNVIAECNLGEEEFPW